MALHNHYRVYVSIESLVVLYQSMQPCIDLHNDCHLGGVLFHALILRERGMFGDPKLRWRGNIIPINSCDVRMRDEQLHDMPQSSTDLRILQEALASMIDLAICKDDNDHNNDGENETTKGTIGNEGKDGHESDV